VVSFTAWLLYAQGKSPQYPLDRKDPKASLDDVERREILPLVELEL
jgi:hypothetical protein